MNIRPGDLIRVTTHRQSALYTFVNKINDNHGGQYWDWQWSSKVISRRAIGVVIASEHYDNFNNEIVYCTFDSCVGWIEHNLIEKLDEQEQDEYSC